MEDDLYKETINVLVIGMAGSGKTALVSKLVEFLKEECISLNLDPAVKKTPYKPEIDIRTHVDYKKIMDEYCLGPNGAILTCLNLFSTKMKEVVDLLKEKKEKTKFVFVDTPGQIEAFTWSASGEIITKTLSSIFPTVLIYVVDTPRSYSAMTFASNLLYSCSILYKTQMKMLLIFNKTDKKSHDFAIQWLKDPESFMTQTENSMSGLFSQSVGNVLEEFYNTIPVTGVSSLTGEGIEELINLIRKEVLSIKKESQN